MLQVPLNPGLRGGKWACLRALCGHDEVQVDKTGAVASIEFLDRLLVEVPGSSVVPGKAGDLAACDCDRLFGALYRKTFGERIESTLTCRDCDEPFDLSFSLAALAGNVGDTATTQAEGPDEEGIYRLSDGRRFRLPTAADLSAVSGLESCNAEAALLERCTVEGDPTDAPELLQAAMDAVGAILDIDLDLSCPECGAAQTVRFDIQDYLLRALGYEKRFLHHEIHCIASAYGWGYQEILGLPREDRRAYARLIQADQGQGRRGRR